jgi:hypothetical protein
MIERLQALYKHHHAFVLVFILFIAFRFMALVLLQQSVELTDYSYYFAWGQLTAMGYEPFVDLWATYPPLFPALMLPVYELSSRIPPWVDADFFFGLLFGAWLLVFESANLVLIYRLAGKLSGPSFAAPSASAANQQPALVSAVFYALLFTPVYTFLGWFEAMPLFFLLLGLDLLLVPRAWGWASSAVAAALGTLVKLTPALLGPVAVRWLGAKLSWQAARKEWFNRQSSGNLLRPALYALIYFGVTIGVGLWLAHGNVELALSSFRVNAMRSPWQSVWALIDGYYGYGLVPVDMRNMVGLETRQWESRIPWLWVTVAFLLIYLWLYTRRYDWTQVRTPVAFTGVSVIWLFLYAKGWSPQFLVWILAFIVLLTPSLFGVLLATALSLLNVVESYIYLIFLPDEQWILVGTVLLRTVLLIFLAVQFLSQIWPTPTTARRMARVSRASVAGLLLLALIGGVLAMPRAAQAYQTQRLAQHPCRAAIELLQVEADGAPSMILTESLPLYQELYPWLHDAYLLRVIDTYSPIDEAPGEVLARTLDELLVEGEAVWWVAEPDGGVAEMSYFTRPDVQRFDEQTLGACALSRLVRLDPQRALAMAQVDGPIRLLHAQAELTAQGDAVDLVLYWQADAPVADSYTVFTQLFDGAGTMLAQQDNLPVRGLAPTDTWVPGVVIRDPYRLVLDEKQRSLVEERAQLHVGLYNETGRQQLTLADGTNADHLTIPLVLP